MPFAARSTPAYDAGQQYRDFGAELLKMIQSGQITPQRANQLKASVYEATRLGNTPQGEAAMKAALSSSRGQMPLQGYDASQQYQDFGQKLAGMIQSGQLTPQRANELKSSVYEASRLGNTNAGKAAMDAALASSSGKLPLQGYDGGQQYQAFGQELAGMLQSGQITPQQANALKSQVYEASRLGNTSAGKAAMDAAISASRAQMVTPPPQGGLSSAQDIVVQRPEPQPEMPVIPQRPQPEIVVTAPQNPQMVTPPPMPQPPVQVMPPPMPQAPTEVIGARMPPPGVRGGDTRIFADQPMALPGGGAPPTLGDNSITNWNPANTSLQKYTLEEALMRDRLRSVEPAPVKNKLPNLTLNNEPQPTGGMGLGSALGVASGGMPPIPQPPSQNLTLSNVPQQLTLSNVPQTLTLGNVPQQQPQGMAIGGLMRKYGGMC